MESIPHPSIEGNGIDHFRHSLYSRQQDGGDRSPAEDDEAERRSAAGARADRAAGRRHRDPLRAPAQRDLGVSRLTVRAALDDLAREGYLVRRRGSGTYVQQPKISQQLTMTSFSEDMRRRGMVPSSTTLSLTRQLAGPRLGRFLNVSPGDEIVVVKRLRLADGVSMAIETLHIPAERRAGRRAAGSRGLVLRAPPHAVRDRDRDGDADDRADGDERGGVGRARGAAPLAGLSLRAHEPRREAAGRSSSCTRSIAATGTRSSPS